MTYSAPIADHRLRFVHNLMLHCILPEKSTMRASGCDKNCHIVTKIVTF
jgi:hypothetical protein